MKHHAMAFFAALLLTACADDATAPTPLAEAPVALQHPAAAVIHVPRDYSTIQAAVDAAGRAPVGPASDRRSRGPFRPPSTVAGWRRRRSAASVAPP